MRTRLTVRLPASLKAQLAAIAEREGVDLSTVIRQLVQHALDSSPDAARNPSPPPTPSTAEPPTPPRTA